MNTEHAFLRDEVLPSWWANALGFFLSLGVFQLELSLQDATHIRIVAGAGDQGAAVAIEGRWRWIEATVNRAHPGGAAGTYDVFVTAKETSIAAIPAPYTDNTDYSFALAIVAAGATPPIVAGVVDVYRKIGSLQWDGAQITRIDQTVPNVSPHHHTHATGGSDPIAPVDIGAATEVDLLAEVARAEGVEATLVPTGSAASLASLTLTGAGTALQVNNNANVGGTLAVTGAATFSSVLNANAAGTGLAVAHNATVGGTLGVTGVATFSSALNANGTGTGLAVANNATVGGTLGVTGAGTFSSTVGVTGLLTATGAVSVPATGSVAYRSAQVAANTVQANYLLTADGHPAFAILGDGTMRWGPGGATDWDVNLYRLGASNAGVASLVTDNTGFRVSGFGVRSTADNDIKLRSNYLPASDRLKNVALNSWSTALGDGATDDWHVSYTAATAGVPAYTKYLIVSNAGQVQLPITGAVGGLLIGGDGTLYRSAANALRTGGAWTVDGNTTLSGTLGVTGTSTVVAINASGAYTQTGAGANTFTGATTFSAAATALSVTNNATITGTLTVGTVGATTLSGTPNFSGAATGQTAVVDTNTTQLATTAFVLAQAAAAAPVMNGVVAVGTSTRYARADHVHPTDTSRAPLASPAFTGTVTSAGSLQANSNLTVVGSSTAAQVQMGQTSLANPWAYTGFHFGVIAGKSGLNNIALSLNRSDGVILASNTYFDGTHWIYVVSDVATQFSVANGGLNFLASSNTTTAGATITWSTIFNLDTSGNLNVTGQYRVGGSQIAASNLSNGTTGTGAVVLAGGTPTHTAGLTLDAGSGTASQTLTLTGRNAGAANSATLVASTTGGVTFNIPATQSYAFQVNAVSQATISPGGIVNAAAGFTADAGASATVNAQLVLVSRNAGILANQTTLTSSTTGATYDDSFFHKFTIGGGGTPPVTMQAAGVTIPVGVDASSATNITAITATMTNAGYSHTVVFSAVQIAAATSFNLFRGQSGAALADKFFVDGTGVIHSTATAITSISAQFLKTDIRPLAGALDVVRGLQPRRFKWREHELTDGFAGETQAGFVAEEVEKVLPDIVRESLWEVNGRRRKVKGLRQGDLMPFLVGAVQELAGRLEELEARVAELA